MGEPGSDVNGSLKVFAAARDAMKPCYLWPKGYDFAGSWECECWQNCGHLKRVADSSHN